MPKDNKIALFIDLDNISVNVDQFNAVRNQLAELGEVVYGRLYGASDRKHKSILEVANACGYDMLPPMRQKKRGGKAFDYRIAIDVMDLIAHNKSISSVAIVCSPFDMVPLYSKLRFYNIDIYALDNTDEFCTAFLTQQLTLDGGELVAKPQKPQPVEQKPVVKKAAPKPAAKPVKQEPKPEPQPEPVPQPEPEPIKQPKVAPDFTPEEVEDQDDIEAREAAYHQTKVANNDFAVLQHIERMEGISPTQEDEELLAQVKDLFSDFIDE